MKHLAWLLLLLPSLAWGQCNLCPSGWSAWTSTLDSFDRADENPLCHNSGGCRWAGPVYGSSPVMKVVGNVATTVAASDSHNGSYWSAATFGPDSEVFATIVYGTNTSGLVLRLANAGVGTADGYIVFFGTSTITIRRLDNGATTTLGASISVSIGTSTTVGAKAVGSNVYAYYYSGSWTEAGYRTDSTYGSAGYIGVHSYDAVGGTSATFNDFGGGDIP